MIPLLKRHLRGLWSKMGAFLLFLSHFPPQLFNPYSYLCTLELIQMCSVEVHVNPSRGEGLEDRALCTLSTCDSHPGLRCSGSTPWELPPSSFMERLSLSYFDDVSGGIRRMYSSFVLTIDFTHTL